MYIWLCLLIMMPLSLFSAVESKKSIFLANTNSSLSQNNNHSLEYILQEALINNPDAKAAREAFNISGTKVKSAMWAYFPTPSIDISQSSRNQGVVYRLDQPIWTGGKLDAGYDMALSKQNESKYIVGETYYALIDNVLKSMEGYLQANEAINVNNIGIKELEDLKDTLDRRVEAGVSPVADKELLNARIVQMNSDLNVAINQKNLYISQLSILSGLNLSENIFITFEEQVKFQDPVNIIIEEIITNHPSVMRFDCAIDSAKIENQQSEAVLWPNLSVRAEHTKGSVYSEQSNSDNLIYFSLQMTPGSGLTSFSNIQAAEQKVLQARQEKQSKINEIKNSSIQHINNYNVNVAKAKGIKDAIASSEKVLESYKRLFIAGKRQWLDLVNASRELHQYRMSLAETEAIKTINAYRISFLRGKINLTGNN